MKLDGFTSIRNSASGNLSWFLGKSRRPDDIIFVEFSVEMFYKH
jgi:hypothetical protein